MRPAVATGTNLLRDEGEIEEKARRSSMDKPRWPEVSWAAAERPQRALRACTARPWWPTVVEGGPGEAAQGSTGQVHTLVSSSLVCLLLSSALLPELSIFFLCIFSFSPQSDLGFDYHVFLRNEQAAKVQGRQRRS